MKCPLQMLCTKIVTQLAAKIGLKLERLMKHQEYSTENKKKAAFVLKNSVLLFWSQVSKI